MVRRSALRSFMSWVDIRAGTRNDSTLDSIAISSSVIPPASHLQLPLNGERAVHWVEGAIEDGERLVTRRFDKAAAPLARVANS